MPTAQTLLAQLAAALTPLGDPAEARAVAQLLVEHRTSLTRAQLLHNPPAPDVADFAPQLARLLRHEPVQYVLGEADFLGRRFVVNPAVLIPRPETEELVAWVLAEQPDRTAPLRVLDVGTGSGCIAVSLAAALPSAQVWGWDVSAGALAVARANAARHGARVGFARVDVQRPFSPSLPAFDLIVSNPPYVTRAEAARMHPNVLAHEPPLALFVDDDRPLVFYERLAVLATQCLAPGGALYAELNETLGEATRRVLLDAGLADTVLRRDLSGKVRLVRARRGQ